MKIFSLFLMLLVVSCTPTDNTKPSNRGVGVVDITDANGSTVLSYSGSYALLIGQSDYTAGWQDLNSIPRELDKVEAVLKKQNFVVERHPNLNSRDLKLTFDNFINKYGYDKDNRLLFFYSGHGHSRGDKGYIVPVDAPNPHSDDKGFFRKAVAMNQVLTWAKNIESKHALFLFDSCFSGTVFKSKNIPRPRQISRAMRLPVRQFITAGSAKEEVPAKSTFTPAFVHALAYGAGDSNNDGYITGMELGFYLWNEVAKNTDQTPQFGRIKDFKLSRGDFVFKVKNTPEDDELNNIKRKKEAELAELDRRIKRKKAKLDSIKIVRPKSKVFQDRLRDGSLGPKMVRIPAGSFRMGDIQGGGSSDEKQHRVSVGEFAMGMYEVTFAEYDKFADATGREKSNDRGWGRGNRPVINVSWHDATAYAKWLSNQTGKKYRLPTEAEWEYAARAGTSTKYWWGNDIGKNRANCYSDYCGDRFKHTSDVGSFSDNKFGLYDTSGNVWEWTCSEYTGKYNGKEKVCLSKNSNKNRVLRGGSWYDYPTSLRTANRSRRTPVSRGDGNGFRLVVLRAAWIK